MLRVAITGEAIRPEEFLEGLASSQDGALLLFLGVVRDHHDGRGVTGLVYEAYQEMAEETLTRIVREAEESFGTDRIAVLHRVGALRVGEVSTAIAVATPHREEAYGASRYVIEEIKKRLPVWKLEEYVEGERRWVEGTVPPVAGETSGIPGRIGEGPQPEVWADGGNPVGPGKGKGGE